eukprot:gene11306-12615_t
MNTLEKKNGSYILIDCLLQNGTEHIFGYPGGAILPIYDELYYWEKLKLVKHILVRHEQCAAHAADAYSRSSKKVGVCFATSGPGATNLVTGIATAKMDSIPLIIITGQVTRNFLGTDAFQETDIFGITLPIVKHSYVIRDLNLLPDIISEAFFLAKNGRPGPVLIDIPKDVGLEEISYSSYTSKKKSINKNWAKTDYLVKSSKFQKFLNFLSESYQPLLYIGGGVIRSYSINLLGNFAKIFQLPLTSTLMGKGSYNELDHLSLGMLGMHGTASANFAISECDLLIAIGTRFDDRVTGKLEEFAVEAEVVHVDIDPAEISKNRCPQLSFLADSKKFFYEYTKFLRKSLLVENSQTKNWLKRISKWKKSYQPQTISTESTKISAQKLLLFLAKTQRDAVFTTDVGQHQMWSAQLLNSRPNQWVSSSGLGTMGFGVPAAIGSKIINPSKQIICITGDSSIQMNIQELATIYQYKLELFIFILNNNWQGMVRQWQESFYSNRYSNSYMQLGNPSFSEVAKAYGVYAKKIQQLTELNYFLKEKKRGISTLLDINVVDSENCYPMVAPGRSNSQMLGLEKVA